MPDWLLTGSARRLAEELEEDGVKLDEHDSVRELLLDFVVDDFLGDPIDFEDELDRLAKERHKCAHVAMASPRFGCERSGSDSSLRDDVRLPCFNQCTLVARGRRSHPSGRTLDERRTIKTSLRSRAQSRLCGDRGRQRARYTLEC
jgi:hypothetical protein